MVEYVNEPCALAACCYKILFELCGASKLRSEVAVQVSTPLCRTYDRLTRVVNETTKGGWDARPYSIAHYGEQVDFYTRVGTRWAGHKSPVGSSKYVALCPGEDSGWRLYL